MAFDSSTLCARTTAGEAELALASLGLTLGQRRVLTLLQSPAAVDELAQRHRLEPEKLARDLTRLADLRLIVLQGPTIREGPAPAAPVSRPTVAESMAPVVIGRSARRFPTLPLAAGAAALVLVVGIWYGTRTHETTTAIPAPSVPVPSVTVAATAPSPPPSDVPSANDVVPVIATVLRGNAAPAEFRPDLRPGRLPVATSSAQPAAPKSPEATTTLAAATPAVASSAPGVAAPIATVAPAPAPLPANEPAVKASAGPDMPPPAQLAMAAPTAVAPRPAVATALKAISRDAPDFPREAIAEGLKNGVVNARIHVDAAGNVTGVDILGAQPAKVFDRAVRKALLRWQFEPLAAGQTSDLDVDVKFQRD